jgi:type IV secretory pathway VirB10-like protein
LILVLKKYGSREPGLYRSSVAGIVLGQLHRLPPPPPPLPSTPFTHTHTHTHTHTQRERERERERERQRDRETESDRQRQTERQRQRDREKETERELCSIMPQVTGEETESKILSKCLKTMQVGSRVRL